MRDAFATVELIHPFFDCRKKFDLLGDLLQRNFIGQLANHIQHNFFLAHVDEYAQLLEAKQTARSGLILARRFLARIRCCRQAIQSRELQDWVLRVATYFSFAGNFETWPASKRQRPPSLTNVSVN